MDSGFLLKGLMTFVRQIDGRDSRRRWSEAGKLVHLIFDQPRSVHARQQVPAGGQMHGSLRTLMGAADYALYVHDPVLFSRVDALYRYVRSQGTRFGFLPENVVPQGRRDPLRDLRADGLHRAGGHAGQQRPSRVLGRHGTDGAKPAARKPGGRRLVAEREAALSLRERGALSRSERRLFRPTPTSPPGGEVGRRMVGGYAGWSSPEPHPGRVRGPALGRPEPATTRRGHSRTAAAAPARTASTSPGRTPPASTTARSRSTCTSTSSCRRPKSAAISRTRAS